MRGKNKSPTTSKLSTEPNRVDQQGMSQSPLRVAVIGGGVSGLAAVYRLLEQGRANDQALDVHLFEGSDRLGGLISTQERDGYQVELGPDSFITNKPAGVKLCKRLGLEDQMIGTDERFRRSLVLRRGRPVPVPDGFLLLTPAKVWPILKSSIFSPLGKLRMGLEFFLPRRIAEVDGDESLGDFVRRRFGREALDRLVQPLVGGIYTSDPEKLSLRATMPRFLDMERDHRSLIKASRKQTTKNNDQASGARYGLFASFKSGCSQLINALVDAISPFATIHLNTSVKRIVKENATPSSWKVEFDDKFETFDRVLLTTPTYTSANLIREASSELANTLDRIEYASSAIVCSGHQLSDITHPLDAFGLVIPAIESRKILAVSFTSRKFPRAPEGRVLLRTFVGGAMQPELNDLSDEELLAIVKGELQSTLGVTGTPDFMILQRHRRAMPQYLLGHIDNVAAIEREVSQLSGLELAGSAFHGVGIPDSIASGEAAADRLLELPR